MAASRSHGGRATCALVAALGLCVGCAPAGVCSNPPVPDCTGTTPVELATLQSTVLGPRCVVMTACHSFEEHQGGVILATPEEAASTLAPYVIPGDARCSNLGFRVTTDEPLLRMPPAGGLSPAERCAVLAWIQAGAAGL